MAGALPAELLHQILFEFGKLEQPHVLIFPEGDPDAVTITDRDMQSLQPMEDLRGNIVDFYVRYLKSEVPLELQDRFYFFNSSSAFPDIDYERSRKLTQRVNLFEKDYIFIPVCESVHWSLFIICHLSSLTISPDKACIFHLDSRGGRHDSGEGRHKKLETDIRRYLIHAWTISNENLDPVRAVLLMKYVEVELPRQDNEFDSGIHMLHCVECFIPKSTSESGGAGLEFSSSQGEPHWPFTHLQPSEVLAKRDHIRNIILSRSGMTPLQLELRSHQGDFWPSLKGQGTPAKRITNVQTKDLLMLDAHGTESEHGDNQTGAENGLDDQQRQGNAIREHAEYSSISGIVEQDLNREEPVESENGRTECEDSGKSRNVVIGDQVQPSTSAGIGCRVETSVSRKRKLRGRGWTDSETGALLEYLVEDDVSCTGSSIRWDIVPQKIGISRTGNECRNRYDSLLKAYRRIHLTGREFSEITEEERRGLGLATSLTKEWYEAIRRFHTARERVKLSQSGYKIAETLTSPRGDAQPGRFSGYSGIYRRAVKASSRAATYEPRFKPPREIQPSGELLKFNYLPLGTYDTVEDAAVPLAIAKFYYGKGDDRLDLTGDCFFIIPPMNEEAQHMCGHDKRRWVIAEVKRVFKCYNYLKMVLQLRFDSLHFDEKNKYEEAVKCHENCLDICKQACTNVGSDLIDYGQVHDYFRLGALHMRMFFGEISPLGGVQTKAFERLSQAAEYLKICVEHFLRRGDYLSVVKVNYFLMRLYGKVDEIDYTRLWLSAQLPFSIPVNIIDIYVKYADIFPQRQCPDDFVLPMKEYVASPNAILVFENNATCYFTRSLGTVEKQSNIEGWTEALKSLSYMFSYMQSYYYRKSSVYFILDSFLDQALHQKEIEYLRWMAFFYAERECCQVMLYQVLSNGLNYSASRKLWDFTNVEVTALDDIRRDCAPLVGHAVFVQYSFLPDMKTCLIYVVDQDGNLSVVHTKMDGVHGSVEGCLTRLYKFLKPKKSKVSDEHIDYAPMMKDLEFLYDVLMRPIAHHLAKMAKELKLILAPSKLLTTVPFAALRDSRTGKYLIEQHAVSLTPSLRALKICSDRLQDLQSSQAEVGLGSIVALGNPAYEVCSNCQDNLPWLGGSEIEVECIADLFGEKTVVKLLKEKATAEELRDWAARPSREGFRQALIHIGSPTEAVDEQNRGKNVIHLGCTCAEYSRPIDSELGDFILLAEKIKEKIKEDDYSDDEVARFDDDEEVYIDKLVRNMSRETISNGSIKLNVGSMRNNRNPGSVQCSACGDATTDIGCSESCDYSTQSNNSRGLTVEEIYNVEPKWRVELIVLSRCSSRGRSTAGLAREFIMAGVPCVVASQWKVDDTAGVRFMKMFYEELRKGADVASALCSAMCGSTKECLVKDWASFCVFGVPSLRIPQALRQ